VRRIAFLAAFIWFSLLPGIQTASAREPEGHLSFDFFWRDNDSTDEPRTAGPAGQLRIGIRPVVGLTGASLTVSAPRGISITPLIPSNAVFEILPPERETDSMRTTLGTLESGALLVLEFEIEPPAGGGGIASFLVEGTTTGGRPVREAVGVAVGRPGSRAIPRHGAMEFPAAPRSSKEE
jgi:hypothetical protein